MAKVYIVSGIGYEEDDTIWIVMSTYSGYGSRGHANVYTAWILISPLSVANIMRGYIEIPRLMHVEILSLREYITFTRRFEAHSRLFAGANNGREAKSTVRYCNGRATKVVRLRHVGVPCLSEKVTQSWRRAAGQKDWYARETYTRIEMQRCWPRTGKRRKEGQNERYIGE